MYRTTTLKNGLRIVTHNLPKRESIAIGLWIGVGGRYEQDNVKGAAHFLEHIVFKGSEKYSCDEIKELVEGVGGSLNAFTSEEQTCYFAKIPFLHLNQTFDVLADMVLNPKIAPRDVTKERTVILEEIKMYHDLPQYHVIELLDGLLWADHQLGKPLAGTKQSVSKMKPGDLKKFHREYYSPGNIVVSACGKLSHQKIVQLVRKKLGGMKARQCRPFEPWSHHNGHAKTCLQSRPIEQMHLAIGIPAYDEDDPRRFALNLLNIILGGNMSSRLFIELREKRGLAYSVSSCYKSMHDAGVMMIRAGVDNQKIVPAIKLILRELKRIKTKGVSESEFKRAKEYLLGQLLLGLEDTMDHMLWIGESMVAKNKLKTLNMVVKKFQELRPGDVKKVAKDLFKEDHFRLAVVGPLHEAQKEEINRILKVPASFHSDQK